MHGSGFPGGAGRGSFPPGHYRQFMDPIRAQVPASLLLSALICFAPRNQEGFVLSRGIVFPDVPGSPSADGSAGRTAGSGSGRRGAGGRPGCGSARRRRRRRRRGQPEPARPLRSSGAHSIPPSSPFTRLYFWQHPPCMSRTSLSRFHFLPEISDKMFLLAPYLCGDLCLAEVLLTALSLSCSLLMHRLCFEPVKLPLLFGVNSTGERL